MTTHTIDSLIFLEMRLGAAGAPDGQETVRDERMRLQVALQRGDAAHIAAVRAEAHRVATMWTSYAEVA